jgi:hypothetical protein
MTRGCDTGAGLSGYLYMSANLSFNIYLRATPQQVRTVLTEPAMLPSWLAGMRFQPDREEDPRRLTCEWLQTEHLEINGGASSVVRFDLTAMGQVTRLSVSHVGLEPGGSLLKVVTPGWPMILSSLKSLMETGEPLEFGIHLQSRDRLDALKPDETDAGISPFRDRVYLVPDSRY